MNNEQLAKFKEALTKLRAEVDGKYEKTITSATEEYGDAVSADANDEATRTIDRRLQMSMSEMDHDRLAEIDEALDRVEDGSYGECLDCGEVIAHKRLELIPYAKYCVECKEEMENDAG